MKMNLELVTLYRYFAYAAAMRSNYRTETKENEWFKDGITDMLDLLGFFYSSSGMFLMYSYSGIYLVIEGWKDLKLSDEKIDKLIESPLVDNLRLFRNATFHYQKEPISEKHLQFLIAGDGNSEDWLNELYSEFERFFMENRIDLPEKLQISLKDIRDSKLINVMREFLKESQS